MTAKTRRPDDLDMRSILPSKAVLHGTIREKAQSGVDYISVGRMTQSAPAADIGLDVSLSA